MVTITFVESAPLKNSELLGLTLWIERKPINLRSDTTVPQKNTMSVCQVPLVVRFAQRRTTWFTTIVTILWISEVFYVEDVTEA